MECYKCNAINSENKIFSFPVCDRCYHVLAQEADQIHALVRAHAISKKVRLNESPPAENCTPCQDGLCNSIWNADSDLNDGGWKTLTECYDEAGKTFPFVVKWKHSKKPDEKIKIVSVRHTCWIDDKDAEYIGSFRDWKLFPIKAKKYICTCTTKDLMTGGCSCGHLEDEE